MKEMNSKTVTLEDYLAAEDEAISGMAEVMRMLNRTEEDEETMCMMLDLIVQVTTKMQGILFGDDAEDPETYEIEESLVVVEEEENHDG